MCPDNGVKPLLWFCNITRVYQWVLLTTEFYVEVKMGKVPDGLSLISKHLIRSETCRLEQMQKYEIYIH